MMWVSTSTLSIFAKHKWGGGSRAATDEGALCLTPLHRRFAAVPLPIWLRKMERIK